MEHTITLTDESIKILDTQKLTENHIVFVTIDTGKLPTQKAQEHIANIVDAIGKVIKPAKIVGLHKGITLDIVENIKTE